MTRSCPYCFTPVQDSQKKCKNCGNGLLAQKQFRQKPYWMCPEKFVPDLSLWFVIAAIIANILLVRSCSSVGKNDSNGSESSSYITTSGDTTGAWVGMTYFVKDRLKCPSSAKFEYAGARDVIKLDNDRYRIKSYVDAQNAFGAPIRMHFEGVVHKTRSSWALEEVNIDE